jgi:hypothetical protein
MPIVQISRIQHRRGKATDLPQLAAGELGWSVDTQRLYIGNGTVSDGAPAIGNTEIVTSGSSAFTTALTYVYKGYLGDSTPIVTGATGDVTRTLQTSLDDYVSVKAFGAVGDGSTADVVAIQRAIEELYSDTDQADARSHRILFFPAGTYNIATAIKIPPYAHLRGEGPDKTILYQSGGNTPVAITEDNNGNTFGSITTTAPTQIQIEGITFKNGEAKGGVSIDNATQVTFRNCKFLGTYSAGGADAPNSKGVTVQSTNALRCSNIIFDQCQFTKFARLVDLDYDVTNVNFHNCDFATAYYGALIGENTDGTTAGLTIGPRNIHFNNNSWSTIGQQAIKVMNASGSVYPRNVNSNGNWYALDIANNFEGIGSIREVPILQFDADECSSTLDFFERTDLRRTDNSSELNMAPEVQGIARYSNKIKQITLADNTSTATSTTLEYPAGSGNLGKSIVLNYKIERGTTVRVGQFTIGVSTNGINYNDDYTESNGDAGVTLTAVIGREDSTSTDKTVIVKYATSSASANATMDVEVTSIV